MIPVIKFEGPWQYDTLLQRPEPDQEQLTARVDEIMQQVRRAGDAAVLRYTREFDSPGLNSLMVSDQETEQAIATLDNGLKAAIDLAINNIRTFHEAQREPELRLETMPGVQCSRRSVPLQNVGLYIPGGTAPLFSTLMMLGIPAVLAGCRNITVCTPAAKDGTVHPAILYVASRIGIGKVFKAGGVQAIAAMTYGTATIPRADKIFGPGNRYVTCAKMRAQQQGTAIDMPAGPSEVAVLADASCVPAFVAADLLSQAEHGADSQVVLVSDSGEVIAAILDCLELQLKTLPRKTIAGDALKSSKAILVANLEEGMAVMNAYAPEHLILACSEARRLASMVVNAGSVFIGNYAPESAGDYASGTNHTLPTNGYARSYSGVSLDSFVRKITFQELSPEGLQQIGTAVRTLARAEGLEAHARAIDIRLRAINNHSCHF
ncbi:histidinol dehydrogenase [Taibaiella chishuiensis]|uniref:Histidinol dehydrogenase n=1 Tax=Taibaiella chishuiensis TaxID=1434707 RepID=A0A2P8DBT7_9BACT|nr:histidinol dehydrogenase [Taibaiella chishuiensis]PSK94672.1 histidinol dehydrogenase [Taibaiella chishuiensis]